VGFQPHENCWTKKPGPSEAAEKLAPIAVLKGHEFTRADKSIGLTPALAAEGCISQFFLGTFDFFRSLFRPGTLQAENVAGQLALSASER